MNAVHQILRRSCAWLLPFACALPLAAQDPTADIAELLRLKDDATAELVTRVAAVKSRAAAEGLIKAYDSCGSIFMRRELVRALGRFDGVEEAEQPALGKVTEVAGMAEEEELREAALFALADAKHLGKHFLRQLVDSPVSDLVREPAMREHVAKAAAEDADWYRTLWNLKQEQRKDKDGNIKAPELAPIRLLAFQGVAPFLGEDELVEALRRETDSKIRRAALEAMRARGMGKTSEMAAWMLDRRDLPGGDRIAAARVLAEKDGAKCVPQFLELLKQPKVDTEDLRTEAARLIAAMNDDGVRKRMLKMVGKGKPHEREFALLAAARVIEPKQLEKELAAPLPEVRRAAAQIVVDRNLRELMPVLRAMLDKPKNPGDAVVAIDTLSALDKGSDAWLTELGKFADSADRDLRNAAIEQIGIGRWKEQIELLGKALAHEDWSTRFAAVDALAAMKHKKVVPLLIEALPKDPGRMSRRIADVLWQLTAQPFEEDYAKWSGWWKEVSATFDIVSETELDKAGKLREQKRLTERTKSPAKFFGLKIESHRVLFVIDVSGSMMEAMYGRSYAGRPAARIDIARQEVIHAIENLDSGALFNVFAFSNGVEKWQKASAGTNNEASRKAAVQWVERLGANGGTNIYDSLKVAFEDKDVDTIYLMTDGEPSVGEVIDPYRIREDVALWNKHRGIKIHTVAVGGDFEILEWLAADSGGTHLKMR